MIPLLTLTYNLGENYPGRYTSASPGGGGGGGGGGVWGGWGVLWGGGGGGGGCSGNCVHLNFRYISSVVKHRWVHYAKYRLDMGHSLNPLTCPGGLASRRRWEGKGSLARRTSGFSGVKLDSR